MRGLWTLKYNQLDAIVSLEPGRSIVARRTLRADEEYLNDHFPRFPVMPGVMMLEALLQAAVWMIRVGDDFSAPLVSLREVRGVKFGAFLAPGQTLEIEARVLKSDGDLTTVKAAATRDGKTAVAARMTLQTGGSGEDPDRGTDDLLRRQTRTQFQTLFGEPG